MSFGFLNTEDKFKEISPLALAFIGDCVFELLVREELVCSEKRSVNKMHELSTKKVCCTAQFKSFDNVKDDLTEEEFAVYKRGRNANSRHKPKNVSRKEYSVATGIEAVFGYLYLKENKDRLIFLFNKMYNSGRNS